MHTQTYRVEFKVGEEFEIDVEVPVGTSRDDAYSLFCGAAQTHLGFKDRHFVVSKSDVEYHGCGGVFQTYLTPNDTSGYIFAEVWFQAHAQ